ncbi:MAG: VanZ family protein, partial [Acutalibacteraceae bacterium]|nr:VanZ family protein [Acutalibacteraceae bacterium]
MKIFRITAAVMLILWMSLIFSLSSQNADTSSGTSGRVIAAVVRIFHSDFDNLTEKEQEEIIAPYQFIVRKGAHFTLYALLGIFSFLTFVTYKSIPFKFRFLLISGICLLYSISDETHQLFISGRSGEVRDVCIDFCGSLLAITLMTLIA